MQKKIFPPQKIRPATPDDLENILEIETESSPNPWKQSFFEAELSGRFSTFLVSHDPSNEEISGFLIFRTVDRISEITNIAVRPSRRREGIALQLISRLVEDLKKGGTEAVFLEVRSENVPAIRLYKKAGFVSAGKRNNYYNSPKDDALIFKLESVV